MDTVGIALIVVVVVISIVVAALLHERSQVAMDRRRAEYARARQVYEARKAIILAQRAAAIEAARTGAPPPQLAGAAARTASRASAAAVAAPVEVEVEEAHDESTEDDGGRSTLTRRERRALRRYEQDRVPDWVHRPLRPGEDPSTPWWVRVRSSVGLLVMVGMLGVATAGTVGAVFLAAGLVLERFAG